MEFSEPELVLPALQILADADGLPTSRLKRLLRERLRPTGRNLEKLTNRRDDHFSQLCRNLKSHNTLERKGLAEFRGGRFYITDQGRQYVRDNGAIFEAATKQGFPVRERQKLARRDFRDALVEEGQVSNAPRRVYQRSKRLTEFARQHFADVEGRIVCAGCGFEGSSRYGSIGRGLIEIHHLIPLYLREGQSEQTQLQQALRNVAPLCPTCHRLVHRDPDNLVGVTELRRLTGYDG